VVDPELQQLIMGTSFPVPRHILAGDPPKPEDIGNIVKLADLIVEFYYAMGFDNVVVMASEFADSLEDADARPLLTALLLRDLQ